MGMFFYPETLKLTQIKGALIVIIRLKSANVCVDVDSILQNSLFGHYSLNENKFGDLATNK